jgi:hypothetical protein
LRQASASASSVVSQSLFAGCLAPHDRENFAAQL